MNDNGLFQIKFENGTHFLGNLFNKDWSRVEDNLKIKEIIFTLGKKSVKMENFREYNLVFETHVKTGKRGLVVNVTLAGRGYNNSIVLIFDCIKGKIIRKEVDKYCEFPWICQGWKKGISEGVPIDCYK